MQDETIFMGQVENGGFQSFRNEELEKKKQLDEIERVWTEKNRSNIRTNKKTISCFRCYKLDLNAGKAETWTDYDFMSFVKIKPVKIKSKFGEEIIMVPVGYNIDYECENCNAKCSMYMKSKELGEFYKAEAEKQRED